MARKRRVSEDSIRGKNIKSDIFLCFLGLGFFGTQYFYFEDTIISIYVYIISIIIIGVTTAFFDYKRYVFTYEFNSPWAKVFCFFQNGLIWGGIVGFLFLSINYYLADTKLERSDFKIIGRSYAPAGVKSIRRTSFFRSGENVPIYTIQLDNGTRKDIMMKGSSYEEIKLYESVTLTTVEGFLGFDIIKYASLNK